MGTVNVLQDELVHNDPQKIKLLNTELLESSMRLNRIIENLLDMNRLNSGLLTLKKEWVEVSDLVSSTISNLKISDHKIIVKENSSNVFLFCDGRLVEHALINLLLNASAYSKAGTIITIIIENNEKNVFVKVLDQGDGIPADKLDAILEKFYRLPGSPAGGVGLGLSIVKGIMEAHGGHVVANNRSDERGALFTLEFPYVEPPVELKNTL
jgi:two-component system sensor histidine kinase KdpD